MGNQNDRDKRAEAEAYKQGILARQNELREKNKANLPNLMEAEATYTPNDGAATLEDLSRVQKRMADDPQESPAAQKSRWSPETLEGLRQLKEVADKAKMSAPEPEKPEAPPEKDEEDEVADDVYDEYAGIRSASSAVADPIRTKSEREAVAKRVKPIDLTEGIMNGEFRQVVPIVPGKLTVEYRTMSPLESQKIRGLAFKMISDDPKLEFSEVDLLSVMNLTAQVVSINGVKEPPHMVGESIYSAQFDEEVYKKKLQRFMHFPVPFAYSLGVHCDWFQARVRQLFTAESIKNG